METLEYELDADDRITRVGGGWTTFAVANDGNELAGEKVIGRSIWEFVSGTELRTILREVFARARRAGRPLRMPFRCDSPEVQRLMSMELVPGEGGRLTVMTQLSMEKPRPDTMPLLDRRTRRQRKSLVMCGWCNRFLLPPWVLVEEAVIVLDLFGAAALPKLSHGICPVCEAGLLAKLDAETKAGDFETWVHDTAPGRISGRA